VIRAVWVIVLVGGACGRFHFDPLDDAATIVLPDTNLSSSRITYLKASNTTMDDHFGVALAVSADGNTIAVGATGEDSAALGIGGNQADETASSAGAVYVFARSGMTWVQQAYVKASNTDAGDGFGNAVALSADGNTLAVSAGGEGVGEDSAAVGIDGIQTDNTAVDSGAAYVFTRTGTTWSQQAYVKASNTDAGDRFGFALALAADGNTLAVGAPDESSVATGIDGNQGDNTLASSGAVYVFTRTAAVWSQQAYVKASNTDAGDTFGESVALSETGDTLAVGAINEDSAATGIDGNQTSNSSTASGAIYVFARAAGVWAQQAYVKASNTGGGDKFGVTVALAGDGDTLVVGAHDEDSAAVTVNGNQASNAAVNAGAAYMFTRTGTTWTQRDYIKAINTNTDDLFGVAVAISLDGQVLAIGASREDSAAIGVNGDPTDNTAMDSGAVYELGRAGNTVAPTAYIKASNAQALDGFARCALSGDGATLVAGADSEWSSATGVDGNQADNSAEFSGAVYVFE
jgi:hypothetical protein